MEFEFDAKKSLLNKEKHGIDFSEAQRIWESDYVELQSKNPDEDRLLVIGTIDSKQWTAIVTMRGKNDERVRIISVRRSRYEEKELLKKI